MGFKLISVISDLFRDTHSSCGWVGKFWRCQISHQGVSYVLTELNQLESELFVYHHIGEKVDENCNYVIT
jgi:hypothetical protein